MNFIRIACFLALLGTGTFLIFQGVYFGPFAVHWETVLSIEEVSAKADDAELARRLWAHGEILKSKWTTVSIAGIVVIVFTFFWYVKEAGKNWNILKTKPPDQRSTGSTGSSTGSPIKGSKQGDDKTEK